MGENSENCSICLSMGLNLTNISELVLECQETLLLIVPEVVCQYNFCDNCLNYLFNILQKWEECCIFCTRCINELELIYHFREKCIRSAAGRSNALLADKEEKSEDPDVLSAMCVEISDSKSRETRVESSSQSVNCDDIETRSPSNSDDQAERSKEISGSLADQPVIKPNSLKAKMEPSVELRRSWLCVYCNKTFTVQSKLNRHVQTHTNKKSYTCNICEKTFRKQSVLNEHYQVHSNEKAFKCDLCSHSYKRIHSLNVHKKEVHNIGTVKPRLREKKFTCALCDAKFGANTLLQVHLRMHNGEKPFKCFICEKAFAYGYYLKKHLACHSDEKPFKCDVCDMRFANNRYLTKHKKRRHSGDKAVRQTDDSKSCN